VDATVISPGSAASGQGRLAREIGAKIKGRPAINVAVAHPCDALSMSAVAAVADLGLITPILVGPSAKIIAAAEAAGVNIASYRLVNAAHSHDSALVAVALVRSGDAQALMKGSLHTDELLHAVVLPETGLRTQRRLSHVYVMAVPDYPRLLLITDAVVNITPSLDDKRHIVQNAVDLAHLIAIPMPRVAILAAIETVSSAMPSTVDAAALAKMADRGQITGCVVDGPLAFDNAISLAAASQKGIRSSVAGRADILVAPDLEAGNMLAKELTFLTGAEAAGVVLGARVPIILTSRADSAATHVTSCALAVLMVQAMGPTTPAPVM
jgi:phosphotransacetylase